MSKAESNRRIIEGEKIFRRALRTTSWRAARPFLLQAIHLAVGGYKRGELNGQDIYTILNPFVKEFRISIEEDPSLDALPHVSFVLDNQNDSPSIQAAVADLLTIAESD